LLWLLLKILSIFKLKVTSIAILDSMSQMAIGLENGTVILMRGDILRDRFTKTRIIHEGKGAVTGNFIYFFIYF